MSASALVEGTKTCQLCFAGENEAYVLATGSLHRFIREKARPSPYLYSFLLRESDNVSSFFCCCNCDSWIRRQKTNAKVLLVVDRFILSILFPGVYTSPEKRTCQRIIRGIQQNGYQNMLASICPYFVLRVLRENRICIRSREVASSLAAATWHSSREQTFVSNPLYAKSLRWTKRKRERNEV